MGDLFDFNYRCIGCDGILVGWQKTSDPICFDCLDKIPDHIPAEQKGQYLRQGKFKFRYTNGT